MTTTLSISQARSILPELIDKVSIQDAFISVKGKIKAVLLDAGEYENLKETLAVLSDHKTMQSIERGLQEIKDGQLYDWQDIKKQCIK